MRGNCSSAVSKSLHGSRSGNHQGAKNISVNIRNKFITIQIVISIAMFVCNNDINRNAFLEKSAQTLCAVFQACCADFLPVYT